MRTPLVPCQHPDCPDPVGGKVQRGCKRPARVSGAKYGVGGPVCFGCYQRLKTRADTTARRAATGRARLSALDYDGWRAPAQPRTVTTPGGGVVLEVDGALVKRHPNVLMALDRLRDELTIAYLYEGSEGAARKVVKRANPVWYDGRIGELVLKALAVGPSPLPWLTEAVYASVPPDRRPWHPEAALAAACDRLVKAGKIVRVRRGWYAIKAKGVEVASFATMVAWARTRPQGVTVAEVAERFPSHTLAGVRRWMQRLGELPGAVQVSEPIPGKSGKRGRWFAPTQAKEGAA